VCTISLLCSTRNGTQVRGVPACLFDAWFDVKFVVACQVLTRVHAGPRTQKLLFCLLFGCWLELYLRIGPRLHVHHSFLPFTRGWVGGTRACSSEHKSWYSWILGSLVGSVYTFGFISMTPQLFINYKLKSVAHLPWKTFVYKFLNTIVCFAVHIFRSN